ncbi:MAG: folate-binding protein, partial [Planctomycetia bacterium]|nr:folate-binding protein [Planctomycetia bacterium]
MEPAPPHEYQALTAGVGVASLPGRTLVELTGADRQTFLHNFCTNDVRGLKPGEGCEAFITSVQGKIIAHVIISCEADRLVLDTVPGQAERIITHLDKYLIREQVVLADRTAEWGEL